MTGKLSVKEIALFGIYGGILYAQKAVLASIPNVHLSAVLIASLTLVYRKKALYPMYVYVFLEGLFGGFNIWWIPYLYVWTILWASVMLASKIRKAVLKPAVYAVLCSLNGFLFGAMFAPVFAIAEGFSFYEMLAWIINGLPYDVIHGISNFILGFLAVPIARLLMKLEKM